MNFTLSRFTGLLVLFAVLPSIESMRAAPVGTVVKWGSGGSSPPSGLHNVIATAAGRDHDLALKNDGSVLAWGDNTFGRATVPIEAQSRVTAISAGIYHNAVLKDDGSVSAWGYDEYGQSTVPVEANSGVKAIAVGGFHTVALKHDGGVIAWGMTNYGQVTVPIAAHSGVRAISAGHLHTLALKNDGTVLAWGQVYDGNNHIPASVPPDLSGVIAIAAGYYHNAALKSDGTVVAWGNGSRGQTAVPAGLSNVAAIAVGFYHTVALKTDGTLVVWGDTQFGQTPAPAGMTGVVAIAAGDFHTLALIGDARWPGTLLSLPNYSYNPQDGRQKITECGVNADGRFSFVFATQDTGAKCIISWTTTFHEWFPFFTFEATSVGSQITERDSPGPRRFFRTTYLPHGVLPAEDFDYPIGTGNVDEQIDPEQNNLYPGMPEGNIERPTSGQPIDGTKWRNAQDVGSYYLTSKGPGYHAGEDWNLGGGPDDIGEQVLAVANGIVMDISPLNNSSNGGWAMVLRHYLLNGEVVDSVYLHIAPPTLSDHSSPNLNGVIGVESWFPFQEGMPVSKGSLVAVVADVDAAIYPDHLHFEMRNRVMPNLPVADGAAAISFYWPHAMGNAYYDSFSSMQEDGIIDPSDFIDQN